jgi:hypothetical protein
MRFGETAIAYRRSERGLNLTPINNLLKTAVEGAKFFATRVLSGNNQQLFAEVTSAIDNR